MCGSCVKGEGCGRKACCGCVDRYVAVWRSGSNDCNGLANVELAIFFWSRCLEGVVVEEIAIVDSDDFGWAAGGEVNANLAVGDDGVVRINERGRDVGYVVPVWC